MWNFLFLYTITLKYLKMTILLESFFAKLREKILFFFFSKPHACDMVYRPFPIRSTHDKVFVSLPLKIQWPELNWLLPTWSDHCRIQWSDYLGYCASINVVWNLHCVFLAATLSFDHIEHMINWNRVFFSCELL